MLLQVVMFLGAYLRSVTSHPSNSKLLLISFDGFRHDYLDLASAANLSTPNFDRLRERGVYSEVFNVFTTKTLPDHYSIVTGLYEENHGLVHNHFFDPVYKETFGSAESRKGYKWFNGTNPSLLVEPIWITNQKAKDALSPHRSGVYHWPASEISFQHHLPFHFEVFSDSTAYLPFEVRAQTLVNWFVNQEAPINFGALYVPEPDHTGHHNGPNSRKVLDKVVELDQGIGFLVSLLEKHNILADINILITSDHGMAQMDRQHVIYLSDYLENGTYAMYGDSVMCTILPQPNNKHTKIQIYQKLKTMPNVQVYLKEEVPYKYHYRNNRRIMPIILVAQKGWMILQDHSVNLEKHFSVGQHGFDNRDKDMHPFLLAAGPAFKKNYTASKVVEQVDLYEMMCYILKIEPNPNDGDLDRVEHLLVMSDQVAEEEFTLITFLAVLIFSAFISGICCVAVCRVYRVSIRHRRISHHLVSIPIDRFDNSTSRLLGESEEEIP